MKCAYCGQVTKGTKEHIISSGILDLFPECYITFDETRGKTHLSDPMVKDVCSECNNKRLSYIDSYAKNFISKYFIEEYQENDRVEIEYDYTMIQKTLLKYAFNDMRSHKEDCSFFDEEIRRFLTNFSDTTPKEYITVLCGLAVNVSPIPDAFMGNLKLRWAKEPVFFSNGTIDYIDYETGQVHINNKVEKQTFIDLRVSYVFRFNSVQFLLLCWDKTSADIEQNKTILKYQYPYYLMNANDKTAIIPICTDEGNYFQFNHIHVSWDLRFEVGKMRKLASGGRFQYKELYEEAWKEEEKLIIDEHPRGE